MLSVDLDLHKANAQDIQPSRFSLICWMFFVDFVGLVSCDKNRIDKLKFTQLSACVTVSEYTICYVPILNSWARALAGIGLGPEQESWTWAQGRANLKVGSG